MKLAASNPALEKLFGKISPPPSVGAQYVDDPVSGLIHIGNVGLTIVMIVAAIYCLLSFLMAGYDYITSNGDTKKTAQANARISNAVVGLIIIVLTPLAGMLLGLIIFRDPMAILSPTIPTIGP